MIAIRRSFVGGLCALVLAAGAVRAGTHTWTGTASNLWSNVGNWTGGVPLSGEANLVVIFPAGGLNIATQNDIASLTIDSISFGATGYSISGTAFALVNGITSTGAGNSISADITLNVAQTFSITSGQLSISSAISGGAGIGYTKNGAGILVLSGTSTYTGLTTVSAGNLVVSGTIASKVNLTGGTLSGAGTIGGLSSDGIVSPGTAGSAIMTSNGAISFNNTSTFSVDLKGTTAGSGFDQLVVAGTVTVGGTLGLSLGFASVNGDSFTIIDNDGADVVTGEFAGMPEGTLITVGSESFLLTYKGGTGNDVVVTHLVTISGIIRDKDSLPFPGVTITDGTRTATSGSDGKFSIQGVPDGSYTVTPTLTGRLFKPASTDVTIASASVSGIDFTLLGTPTDIDGDGFSDAVETAAGTSISDPANTPFSGKLAPAAEALTLDKIQIKLNFSIFLKGPVDSLSLSGSLPVANGFSPTGQQVIVDVGGVIRVFHLSDKGISPKGDDSFKLNKPKDGLAKYSAKFSKGAFVDSFVDELLRATIDAKNEDRQVVVTIYFTERIFSKTANLLWTAKMFKTGNAKIKPVK